MERCRAGCLSGGTRGERWSGSPAGRHGLGPALPYMGGIETTCTRSPRRLAALGVEVTVLTTDTSGELPPSERVDGYDIRRWPAYPRNRDYYWSSACGGICGESQSAYDVVHIQGVHTLVPPTALAAVRSRIPSVLTFHTGGNSAGLRNFIRPLGRVEGDRSAAPDRPPPWWRCASSSGRRSRGPSGFRSPRSG